MNFSRHACLISALVFSCSVTLAQPEGSANMNPAQNFHRDGNWAGVEWDGNTSWVTVDGKGLVYVLVRNKPYVRIYTRDGSFVRDWSGPEELGSAHSITIDASGNAWISDSKRHVIRKYDTNGQLLMTLGKPDTAGDNDSRDTFNQPNHVFIVESGHDKGDIYVSDGYVNSRVVHFSATGEFKRIIGGVQGSGPGEFQAVHGVALDSRGNILINDSENFRVNVYDPDGNYLETWPFPSRGGIEVRNDVVYISDVNQGEVNIVKDGQLLDTAYAPRAHGLAVDTDGTLYTSGASRKTVFKLTPK